LANVIKVFSVFNAKVTAFTKREKVGSIGLERDLGGNKTLILISLLNKKYNFFFNTNILALE